MILIVVVIVAMVHADNYLTSSGLTSNTSGDFSTDDDDDDGDDGDGCDDGCGLLTMMRMITIVITPALACLTFPLHPSLDVTSFENIASVALMMKMMMVMVMMTMTMITIEINCK